jgi:capsid protein
MVFRRPPNWTSLQFDRMIPARFADMLGYYSRIDQVRGISPFASAANTFRDLYEGFDYALLKAKATQFLGIKLKRKGSDPLELGQGERRPEVDTTTGQPLRGDYSGMRFDKGPQVIDMDDGDDMEILESQQPSTQFQAFCQIMTMVAMKALDVPFSWFDESHTNFSGSRMAGIRYEGSAKIKRERLRLLLDKTTAWRLGLAIADDEIKLPSKMQPHDMRWQWSHPGMPLFDPLKEISAKIARINAGLSSPQRECEEDGSDFEGNIDERESAEQYAHDHNVIISTALPAVTLDDPANQQTQTVDANEAQNQEDEDEKNRAKAHKALWGN